MKDTHSITGKYFFLFLIMITWTGQHEHASGPLVSKFDRQMPYEIRFKTSYSNWVRFYFLRQYAVEFYISAYG